MDQNASQISFNRSFAALAAPEKIHMTSSHVSAVDIDVVATISRLTDIVTLGDKWRELERRSSCSFFQSWTWIGTWLSQLHSGAELYLLEVTDGNLRIGLAVFGAARLTRHGFVRSRALLLHETGDAALDRMTIEYNSIVAETGREREVIVAAVQCLGGGNVSWDEIMISGVEAPFFQIWHDAVASAKWRIVLRQESTCPRINLETIRQCGGDYLALLSSNTRQQVRRAMKAYEKSGPLAISRATSEEIALEYLRALQALHNRHWRAKGKEGAFPSEFTRRFHEQLVEVASPRGEAQILRVVAGDEIVGYLYNFVKDGHVYFYQAGFNYVEDPKMKPGLVCHYLAVMYNVHAGNGIYDFLAGSQRYKESLATGKTRMYWLACQKPRLSFVVERLLKRAKLAMSAGARA